MSGRQVKKGRGLVIAIDGPSGVGKSTISQALAERLDCRYIDTGAMYRAVALLARARAVPPDDPLGLAGLGRDMEIEFIVTETGSGVTLDGEDVTLSLRLPGVSEEASRLSRFPEVREVLVEKQRELGRQGKVVMEGRDIGTVVLPEADLKVFLDAEPEERAKKAVPAMAGEGHRSRTGTAHPGDSLKGPKGQDPQSGAPRAGRRCDPDRHHTPRPRDRSWTGFLPCSRRGAFWRKNRVGNVPCSFSKVPV